MTGVSIDHMVALTILVVVLLGSMGVYSQVLGDVVAYQRNMQVAIKAADLVDSISLNPGSPLDWGQSNSTPSTFGLQDPEIGGCALSPFSVQRLRGYSGEMVYYDKTDSWYLNVSMSEGGSLLLPIGQSIDYSTVTRLLGVNGSYGFQLSIEPTLRVSVSELTANPLRLKIEVRGPGHVIKGAILSYCLFRTLGQSSGEVPTIAPVVGTAQTDSSGSAILEFPSINGEEDAYSFTVQAHISGLAGVGYFAHDTMKNQEEIVPIIADFEEGRVLITHSYDVHYFGPPEHALFYNATFFGITDDWEFQEIQIDNSTGKVNYGEGWPYAETRLPPYQPGILFIAYRTGNTYGIVMMPWGISTLGVSFKFGEDEYDPSFASWVATELRQVTVGGVSYQMKLAVWSTAGYQVPAWNPVGQQAQLGDRFIAWRSIDYLDENR